MKVNFICDESGAKGKETVGEQKRGEVGVFAGCFVPDRCLNVFDAWSTTVASKYFSQGKVHISALPKPEQICLEREVFEFVKVKNMKCAYEAIYPEGFKEGRGSEIQLYEDIENLHPSLKNLYKKYKKPMLLHERLFAGMIDKAIAFIHDYCDSSRDELLVMVDRVDSGILKIFENSVQETLDMEGVDEPSNAADCREGTSGKLVGGKEMDIFQTFRNLRGKITIKQIPSELTIVPDVIAHSLLQHFSEYNRDCTGSPLHIPEALDAHELKHFFYGQADLLGGMNWWTDAQYMHPEQKRDDDDAPERH